MKNLLLLSLGILFFSLTSCITTEKEIMEQLEKYMKDCSLPEHECGGNLGDGLLCGDNKITDLTPCIRGSAISQKFDINVIPFVQFEGKGKAALGLATKPQSLSHAHIPGDIPVECAPIYINYYVRYEGKGELSSETGAGIMHYIKGEVGQESHIFLSGAKCKTEIHPLPLFCGG